MNVNVERVSPTVVRIHVQLPAPDVDAEYKRQLQKFSKKTAVPGFRPGRAPESLLLRMFGPMVSNDVAMNLIQEHLGKIFEEAGVTPLAPPAVDPGQVVRGQPFAFSMKCEIKPIIEVQGYRDLIAPPLHIEIKEEQIEQELERLRQRHGQLITEEDPAAQVDIGKVATIDFEGRIDGALITDGNGSDVEIELGKGMLMEGIEDHLLGAKVGERRVFDAKLTEAYGDKSLVGQVATFTVDIKSIGRKILPALDDEFARDVGVDNLEALRLQMRQQYEEVARDYERRQSEELLIQQLIANNPIELPKEYLADRVHSLMGEVAKNMIAEKPNAAQLRAELEKNHQAFEERAAREMRRHLLLESVAKAEGIKITDEDLDAHFAKIAEQTGQNIAHVRASYHEESERMHLKSELLYRRVADRLLQIGTENATKAAASLAEAATSPPSAESPSAESSPAETVDAQAAAGSPTDQQIVPEVQGEPA